MESAVFATWRRKYLLSLVANAATLFEKEHVFGHPKMTRANLFIGCVEMRRIGHFPARIPASKVRGGEIQIQIRKFLRRKRIAPLRIDGKPVGKEARWVPEQNAMDRHAKQRGQTRAARYKAASDVGVGRLRRALGDTPKL
jgi:hypothetical protein